MSEINGSSLLLEISQDAASLLVALAEGAQGGDGLGLEAEGGGQLGPVDVSSSSLNSGHDDGDVGWSGER